MQMIAVSKRVEGHSIEKIKEIALDETRRSWALYASGDFRGLYFDQQQSKGIIIMEVRDKAHARELLDSLPLVAAGQIDFDLYEMGPYTRTEALFAEQYRPA